MTLSLQSIMAQTGLTPCEIAEALDELEEAKLIQVSKEKDALCITLLNPSTGQPIQFPKGRTQ